MAGPSSLQDRLQALVLFKSLCELFRHRNFSLSSTFRLSSSKPKNRFCFSPAVVSEEGGSERYNLIFFLLGSSLEAHRFIP
jgi:hypothetical protein